MNTTKYDEVLRDLGDEIVMAIEGAGIKDIIDRYLSNNPDLLHAIANGNCLLTDINMLTTVNCVEVLNEDGEVDELRYVSKVNVNVMDFELQ